MWQADGRVLSVAFVERCKGQNLSFSCRYCLKYVQLLLEYRIKPILVFDGAPLPAKEAVNTQRSDTRKRNKEEASRLAAAGQYNAATKVLQRSTEVTWDIVSDVLKVCWH